VPQSTQDEFNEAVACSQDAFKTWKKVPISTKVRYMLKYQDLLKKHQDDLCKLITHEHGKSLVDAAGDVFRGYEVVEHACSFSSLIQGETVQNVASGVDIYSFREPLGVVAGIAPYNFPAMIPLWMFPLSITCGNTYLLKPSEKVAGTSEMLIDLLKESGVPDGVVTLFKVGTKLSPRFAPTRTSRPSPSLDLTLLVSTFTKLRVTTAREPKSTWEPKITVL